MNIRSENAALVLGLSENGLGVGRSLGRAGITVLGLDSSRTLAFCSRYVRASVCPHPLDHEEAFVSFLLDIGSGYRCRPVLFVTSDDFLLSVSRNRERLQERYLINLPDQGIVECITDKLRQHELASQAGVSVPKTFVAASIGDLLRIQDDIPLPAFIKGREVNSWRKRMGVNRKGFVVSTREELLAAFRLILRRGAVGLVQEIIPGPDTQHFKASCYVSQRGDVLAAFGLQKIRQQPTGFGFGCLVQSINYPELLELGTSFLKKIRYRGVGSAEFKLDQRDGQLKLIELNPRYWQQNVLADRCGMNFPLIHYLDVTGQEPGPVSSYRAGIKWVNLYADLESFRDYRRLLGLPVMTWFESLRGPRVCSDYALDDVLPGLYESAFGHALPRAWGLLLRAAGGRSGSSPTGTEARIPEVVSDYKGV